MTHNSCHNLSNKYINLQVPDLTYNDCQRRTHKPEVSLSLSLSLALSLSLSHAHARTRTHTHTYINFVRTLSMKGDLNINRVTNIYYPTKPQFRLMQNGGENMMLSITIV